MTTTAAGLTFADAANQADTELGLTEPSVETVISTELPDVVPQIEQPAVETETKVGVLGSLVEQTEKPKEESAELYEVNGEMITLDQLRSGYMMHADYTQKTQELADKGRDAEKALTLLRLLEEHPVETVQKLYQTINSGAPVSRFVETHESTQSTNPTNALKDIEDLVDARVAEKLENDPRLAQVEAAHMLDQINEIFSEIEEMYSVTLTDADKQLTLEKAQAMESTDIKFVFGGLMNEANQKKIALQNAKNVTPVAPEYVPPKDQAPVTPQKFKDFRAAVNATLAAEQALEV